MQIGGFHKQSLIDFAGNISSIIFTYGCNFNCSYCHNQTLINTAIKPSTNTLNEKNILHWIKQNNNMLDAIVITGGEPTLQKDLVPFAQQIKNMGLKIKLDTNGTNPEILEQLIELKLVDYIAMDIKAPLNLTQYQQITGKHFSQSMLDKIHQSVQLISKKMNDYEFRTSADKRLTTKDFLSIAEAIAGKYFIQDIRATEHHAANEVNQQEITESLAHLQHIELAFRN